MVDGFPVKFEVKVIGHPRPTLKWSFNGEEIKPNDGRFKQAHTPDGKASLFIGLELFLDSIAAIHLYLQAANRKFFVVINMQRCCAKK